MQRSVKFLWHQVKDVLTCCACRVAAAATERGSALPFRVWSAEERSSRIFLSAIEKNILTV